MDGRTSEESCGSCLSKPQNFNPEAFRRVISLIEKYKNYPGVFKTGALLALANIAGGEALVSAMDNYKFAPCSASSICQSCWINEWCIHKHVTFEDRLSIQYSLDIFTSNEITLTPEEDRIVYKLDKTHRSDIRRLEMIAMSILFRSNNDKSKKQTGNLNYEVMWAEID